VDYIRRGAERDSVPSKVRACCGKACDIWTVCCFGLLDGRLERKEMERGKVRKLAGSDVPGEDLLLRLSLS